MNGEWKPLVVRLLCFYRIMGIEEKKTYAEKLQDERWIARSKEIKVWDSEVCQLCGDNTHLQVHHLCYDKSREPWEYPKKSLVTLCDKCHKTMHEGDKRFYERLNDLIVKLGLNGVSKNTILGMLEIMLQDSFRYKEGNIFDHLYYAPYSEPYWIFGREHKNNVHEKSRLREEAFLKLARKAYEWNTGKKDFSEESAFNNEYYEDIIEYKKYSGEEE